MLTVCFISIALLFFVCLSMHAAWALFKNDAWNDMGFVFLIFCLIVFALGCKLYYLLVELDKIKG